MITSFADEETRDIYDGKRNSKKARKRLDPMLWGVAQRKLAILTAAHRLEDLRIPPQNRLEKLKGDLKDWYSIRINDQWRIVFHWGPEDVSEVKIVDYH